MDSGNGSTERFIDGQARLMQLMRRRYELSRLRSAAAGALPIVALVAVAVAVTQRPFAATWFGGAAIAVGIGFLWYGRGPQRAVLPGIAAGAVPLVLALCAGRLHACGPEGCTSYCVPACALGGVIAGLVVAGVGFRRRERGATFWVAASGLAILIGAMGCSCVGAGGLTGLLAGYAAGNIPTVVRRLAAARR